MQSFHAIVIHIHKSLETKCFGIIIPSKVMHLGLIRIQHRISMELNGVEVEGFPDTESMSSFFTETIY